MATLADRIVFAWQQTPGPLRDGMVAGFATTILMSLIAYSLT